MASSYNHRSTATAAGRLMQVGIVFFLLSLLPTAISLPIRLSASKTGIVRGKNKISSDELILSLDLRGGGRKQQDAIPTITKDAQLPTTKEESKSDEDGVDDCTTYAPSLTEKRTIGAVVKVVLELLLKAVVWCLLACRRACAAAWEEFQRPLAMDLFSEEQEEGNAPPEIVKLLIWCLVKAHRMTLRSTVAFWGGEAKVDNQGTAKAKRKAPKILKSSKTVDSNRRAKRSKFTNEEKVSDRNENAFTRGETVGIEPLEEAKQQNHRQIHDDTNTSNINHIATPSNASEILLPNITTAVGISNATSIPASPRTARLQLLERTIRAAKVINRISAWCIVVAAIVFFGSKAWDYLVMGEMDISKLLQQIRAMLLTVLAAGRSKMTGKGEPIDPQQQQQQPKEGTTEEQAWTEPERRPLQRGIRPEDPKYKPFIARRRVIVERAINEWIEEKRKNCIQQYCSGDNCRRGLGWVCRV